MVLRETNSRDIYALYSSAVQTPTRDANFLSRYFRKIAHRPLRRLREDFCGTANILCEFVKMHRDNYGIGVDLSPRPLAWCRNHTLPVLAESQRARVRLICGDATSVRSPKVDGVFAFNFSYFALKTRDKLRAYFKNARRSLVPGGLFIIDHHGGIEVPIIGSETWNVGNRFKYVWEVSDFDPLTHRIIYKIHFLFKDGSRIRNAFTYDWRLWTIPELQELLREAGFKGVHVLWEETNHSTGYGNNVMRRVKRGKLEGAWYAMLIGRA